MARRIRSTAPKAAAKSTPVESVRHGDRRTTIPTSELAHLVEDPAGGPPSLLYPRDPSLDPQLVWKGKDAQDRAGLEVPVVPIYVQEKVVPQALVENLRKTAAAGEQEPELTLFSDFDGLDDFEMVDFYEHDKGNWSNRMILGDSLAVMASLAEKEDLRGKVQMIYVDPPYGIKFGSNWQVSTRKRDVKDGKVTDASREPEVVKAFRDTWELGIHSYLTYLRDRLTVARELLTETGSIFVQIGDENVHLVRALMDEVFGAENFCATLSFRTKIPLRTTLVPQIYDHLIWFAKSIDAVKFRRLFKRRGTGADTQFTRLEQKDGSRRKMTVTEMTDPAAAPAGSRPYRLTDLVSAGRTESCVFRFDMDGRSFFPGGGKSWKTNVPGMAKLLTANRVEAPGATPGYVFFAEDFPVQELDNVWSDTQGATDRVFVVQTNTRVIERCLLMTTDPGDLVLDPTCGAGTTAYVAEQWGRRWITADTARVALALARTRLMAARYPSYLLADSVEGARKEAELTGAPTPLRDFGGDVRQGFVYKRVPHVTLGSIAQNPDIHEGMSREDIDRAIARHAEVELLVDQPYVDPKRVRVSGRFTVESLSPHRMLAAEEEAPAPVDTDGEVVSFEAMILDNLRAAGVQNTYKGERLAFDRLEPWAGEWIQAEGVSTDTDGAEVRVAVSLGPEHGTVGPRQIVSAAQEAARAVPGFDLLLVVGFAFDPSAWQQSTEINSDLSERKVGRMRVLLSKANPDLAMGDELLKKTGAGNLFMVFGEPDIDLRVDGGEVTVEVRGLDVYDPTTGEVRPSSTDDIAAWFVDTDYDGRSFFVRHAYFTGGPKPYESLRKALRADIDEDAWASLYSTVSRPFPVPGTGKIAVKVINHYGDEVLQVYEVAR